MPDLRVFSGRLLLSATESFLVQQAPNGDNVRSLMLLASPPEASVPARIAAARARFVQQGLENGSALHVQGLGSLIGEQPAIFIV